MQNAREGSEVFRGPASSITQCLLKKALKGLDEVLIGEAIFVEHFVCQKWHINNQTASCIMRDLCCIAAHFVYHKRHLKDMTAI